MKNNRDLKINESKESISKCIKNKRREKNLTQIQLSQKANVSLATVRNIEQGSGGYSMKILNKIAIALEMSPPEIVALTNIEGVTRGGGWTGREFKPTKKEEEFKKGLELFFNELVTKVPTVFHEILFDMDYFVGLQEFLSLAIKYDVSIPDGILPKGNRNK